MKHFILYIICFTHSISLFPKGGEWNDNYKQNNPSEEGTPLDTTKYVFFLDGKKASVMATFGRLESGIVEVIIGYNEPKEAISHFGEIGRNGIVAFRTVNKAIQNKTNTEEVHEDKVYSETKTVRETTIHERNYVVNGKAPSQFNNRFAMLFTFKNDTIFSVDTTIVKDGNFAFYGKEYLEDQSLITIGNYPNKVASSFVILESGNIAIDMNNANSDANIFIAQGTSLNNKMKAYSDTLDVRHKTWKDTQEQVKNSLITKHLGDSLLRKMTTEGLTFSTNFKLDNISNLAGKIIFKRGLSFINDPDFDKIYNLTGEDLKADPQIKAYIKKREEWETREKKRTESKGKQYIDIEINTLEGESKLSNYVSKSELTLVDFWASWCSPCIAEIPHLKSLFQKYEAQGLSIVSISIDDDEVAWKKSLDKQEMPWAQLITKKGDSKKLMDAYNLKGIPYILLINKEGKIVEVNLRGQHLETFVKLSLKE